MKVPLRFVVSMVLLTLAAGALGGWLGVHYGEHHSAETSYLDTIIHHNLDLTAAQNDQIATLELHFAEQRKGLEAEMRAANQDLAIALDTDHIFGPKEQAAVARFHRAEMDLQKATIQHVLSMRAVLDTNQSKAFDRAIYKALTTGSS